MTLNDITDATPLRLTVAAKLMFPDGSMTVSGLRRERDKGNLIVMRIAGKEYTTLAALKGMMDKCRGPAKEPASTRPRATATGTSGTDRKSRARAALSQTKKALRERLQTTSTAKQTVQGSARVIPIK